VALVTTIPTGRFIALFFAFLLCLGSALTTTTASGKIYRWVDENGVVNFTQQKPKDAEASQIESSAPKRSNRLQNKPAVKPTPAIPTPTPAPEAAGPSRLGKEPEIDPAAKKRYDAALAEGRAKACSDATKLLNRLQNSGRIRTRNADGEEVAMSDEERARRATEAQEMIDKNCD